MNQIHQKRYLILIIVICTNAVILIIFNRNQSLNLFQTRYHSITQSLNHSITQSLNHSITQSLNHSINQSVTIHGQKMQQCPSILYYKGFGNNNRINAGLDHNLVLFQYQLADGVHYNFSHIIVENMDLQTGHNHGIAKSKINAHYSHYFDMAEFAHKYNITILESDSKRAKQLLFAYSNQTHSVAMKDICDPMLSKPIDCGVMIRTWSGSWWHKPPCFAPNQVPTTFEPVSKHVLQCLNALHIKTSENECIIHGRVRKGDMLSHYTYEIHKRLVSAEGITSVFTYLAQKFCAGKESIAFYLATNGKSEFIDTIRANLLRNINASNVRLMTGSDVLNEEGNNSESKSECFAEMKRNNYLLFAVEKEMPLHSDIIDVSFAFNAKFAKSDGDRYRNKYLFPDAFQVFYGDNRVMNVSIDAVI